MSDCQSRWSSTTQTDLTISLIVSACVTAYVWLVTGSSAPQEVPLSPAAHNINGVLGQLESILVQFQRDPSHVNFSEIESLYMKLMRTNLNHVEYIPIWPRLQSFKQNLHMTFDSWNEAGEKLRKAINELPKLTVNTAPKWKKIKAEMLEFEINSADYDVLYGICNQTRDEIVFSQKAIQFKDLIQKKASQAVPIFPKQFPLAVIEEQTHLWTDQIRELSFDPVLKEIVVEAGVRELAHLQRLQLIHDD